MSQAIHWVWPADDAITRLVARTVTATESQHIVEGVSDCTVSRIECLTKLSSPCFLAVKYSFCVCDVAEGGGGNEEGDDDDEGGGSGAAVVAKGSEEGEPVPLWDAEGAITAK